MLCVTFAFLAVILPPSSQWITQRAQKKQTKYLHLIKKNIYTFVVHNKKYKIMEKTTDTPPGQADALRKPHRRLSGKEISGTRKQV